MNSIRRGRRPSAAASAATLTRSATWPATTATARGCSRIRAFPNVVTEYGSTMEDRPGRYAPGWGDLPSTPGADRNVEGSWRLPWRSGEVLWCAFDHGSIAGRKFGGMGMVDYFRLPKRQWYWYRNDYLHIPPPAWPSNGVPAALKLTADKTTLNSVDGTDDAQIIVTVVDKDGKPINNCPPVTLDIEVRSRTNFRPGRASPSRRTRTSPSVTARRRWNFGPTTPAKQLFAPRHPD